VGRGHQARDQTESQRGAKSNCTYHRLLPYLSRFTCPTDSGIGAAEPIIEDAEDNDRVSHPFLDFCPLVVHRNKESPTAWVSPRGPLMNRGLRSWTRRAVQTS